MATLTKYAGTVSQTTGGSYVSWSNLANIKNNTVGSYATSSTRIKGKSSSPNRPAPVMCTNFSFNLPTGAEVSKVTVEYRHRKEAYDGHVPNVPAPTISLLGVSGFSGKGSAPTTTMTTYTKSFSTSKISRSQVNSSSFGVKIDYPANTNSYEGTMSISLVRVTVEYKTPSYTVSVKKAEGGYNNEEFSVECSISNKNLTSYNPTLTLSAPAGFSYKRAEGTGTATKVNNRTVTWNPSLTKSTGTSTIRLVFDVDVTYPSGSSSYTGTFTLSENLNSTTGSYSATIIDRPVTEDETDPTSEEFFDLETGITEVIQVTVGTEIQSYLNLPYDDNKSMVIFAFPVDNEKNIILKEEDTPIVGRNNYSLTRYVYTKAPNQEWYYDWQGYDATVGGIRESPYVMNEIGMFTIQIFEKIAYADGGCWDPTNKRGDYGYSRQTPLYTFYFEVRPQESELTIPFFSFLTLNSEEFNRLGAGYTYIVQSDIKHTSDDTFVRDWYKNNRIGIFNNKLKPLFEDRGTTNNHNDNWALTQYMTRTDTGTTISNTSGSIIFEAVQINNTNLGFENKDMIVEFEIVENPSSTNLFRFNGQTICTGERYAQQDFDFSQNETGKFRFVYNKANNTILKYKNGTYVSTYNHQFCGNMGFLFRLESGQSIKFKDFVVYPVIDNLSPQQIFENAEYWSEQTAGLNEYNSVECEFTYDSDYPLYIIITGDYPEAETYGFDNGDISFNEPCIIEKNSYNGREPNGNYPTPIENLLSDTDFSTIALSANETGTPVRLYDFPLDDDYGTNESLAIRGIQVIGTLESSDNLIVFAKLISPNGEIGQRSIALNVDDTDSFAIGGLGDLWGFTTLQMTNLNHWQVELSASNILATGESFLNIQEVQIVFYLEIVDKQEITIKINDEDIAYYGAFIEAVNIPEGLNTDTSFITVDGTDMNDAYRQNIREKTITVDFNISECDLKTSTDLLRQITKLFTNEKDQYNRPIPKRITFSHYPEDYFEYIMEQPFDVSTNISDYDVTAKLTIPAGTSYSRKDTVTNTVGNANGLAALRPIITIQPSGANIEIKEGLTEQNFTMSYGGTWTDKIVEINCDDRVVLLKDNADDDGKDISKYVDHNSDWFRLSGEFNFEAVNCVIQTVTFNERW